MAAQKLLKALDIELTAAMAVPFYDWFRFKLVMAGERAAKSFTGAVYAVTQYQLKRLITEEPQLIWVVGYDYDSAIPEFDYMCEMLIDLGVLRPEDVHKRDEGRDKSTALVYDNPSSKNRRVLLRVETISAANAVKLARVAPDGILACEVAMWTESIFFRAQGRLAQKRGWMWASGSFESSTDWLAQKWKDWQPHGSNPDSRSYDIPSWSNHHVFPGGRNDPEILAWERRMPANLFSQRVAGKPAPPQGMVYDDFDPHRHIQPVHYDPLIPVQVWIDPGFAGAYAVLAVQQRPGFIDVVDEIYERGKTTPEIIAIARTRPWWRELRGGVIDVAGRQHHGERSVIEGWAAVGVRLRSKKVKLTDSIERVHTVLRGDGIIEPMLRVAPHCRGLLSEMDAAPPPFSGGGPWCYKLDREGNAISELPETKNNHACMALAYGLIDTLGHARRPRKKSGGVSWIGNRGPSWMEWGSRPRR